VPRDRASLRLVLAVVAILMATTVSLPGTHAVWTTTTAASNSVSTKKVLTTTVDNTFMDWIDASGGTPGSRKAASTAYIDGATSTNNNPLSPTFDPQYYEEVDFSGSDLPPSVAVSGVTFNYAFRNLAAGETTCFYLASWRYSDNTQIAVHGSAGSPLGCVTTTTITTFNIALPEITSTTTLKNSFAVRIYITNSASDKYAIDGNTLTGNLMYNNGTQSYSTFSEYEYQRPANQPAGASLATWALARIDGPGGSAFVASGATTFAVSGTYTMTNYLEFDQTPGVNFVPTGATITSSSLSIVYYEGTSTGGNVMCAEADVYLNGGATPTITPQSSGANCSSSTATETTWTINTTAAINTPALADSVKLRLSAINTVTAAALKVDFVKLTVTYSLN
jgi:hypothetical protein